MATFIEVFVLIAVAAGGAAIVFEAAASYPSALQGPSITIEDPSFRQGAYVAIERATVVNSGEGSLDSFSLSSTGLAPSSTYCYSLFNPSTMALVSSDCPPSSLGPGLVSVPYGLGSGQGVIVEVTIEGHALPMGSSILLSVTSASGAEQSVGVQVTPA